MMNVYAPADCGKAPRKEIVLDFMKDILVCDVEQVLIYLHEKIIWQQISKQAKLDGIIKFMSAVQQLKFEVNALKVE